MSVFTFEIRECPRCGDEFAALTFWDADAVCSDCGHKEYAARLARYNQEHDYEVVSIGGAMPTQAEGRFPDGRPFYFRARHGDWWLYVGKHGEPTEYRAWATSGEVWAAGEDPSNGWMEDAEVLAILDTYDGSER